VNYRKLKRTLERKFASRAVVGSPRVGNVLRRKRLEKNMTQEEAADGLFSVSYLSKVENDKLTPNERFVEEMSRKFGIDLKAYTGSFNPSTLLKRAIRHFYDQDSSALDAIIEEAENQNSQVCADLFTAMRLHVLAEYEDCSRTLESLHAYYASMDLQCASTLIVVHAANEFARRHYRRALKLLNVLADCEGLMDPVLKTLEHFYAFLIQQSLGYRTSSMRHYDLAIKGFAERPNASREFRLRLGRLYFTAFEKPSEASRELDALPFFSIPSEHVNLYHTVCILSDPSKYMNEEMLCDAYLNVQHRDEWYYRFLTHLYALNRTDENLRARLVERFKDSPPLALQEAAYFHSMVLADTPEYKRHLQDVCLPLAERSQERFYLEHCTDRLSELAIRDARYKEAVLMLRRKHRIQETLDAPI